jgi:hypothetical protein
VGLDADPSPDLRILIKRLAKLDEGDWITAVRQLNESLKSGSVGI